MDEKNVSDESSDGFSESDYYDNGYNGECMCFMDDPKREKTPEWRLSGFEYEMCLDVGLNPETEERRRKEEFRAKLLGENLELIDAIVKRNQETAMKLINKDNVNSAKDENGNSCLHLAVEIQDLVLVGHMLQLGVDIECRDKRNRTPLLLAVEKGRKEIVEKLVEANADVNARDGSNCSVLHHVLENKIFDFEVVRLLLDKGAKPDASSIRWAIHHREPEFCEKMILAVNDKLGSVDNDALSAAVEFGKEHLVRLLLDLGLSPNSASPTEEGILYTALTHIYRYPSYESWMRVLKLLLEHGADAVEKKSDFPPIKAAVVCGDVASIKLLMEHGVDFKNRRSLLTKAAENSNVDVLRFLLSHKLHHSDDKNEYSVNSALIAAINSSRSSIDHVKELLKAGANVNCSYDSVLLCAVKEECPSPEVVNLLLYYGAEIDLETVDEAINHPADDGDNANHIIQHVVLRRSRGLQIDSGILRFIRRSQFKKYYKKCIAEIDKLRRQKVSGSITLYDILSQKDLTEFAINDDLMKAIKSLNVKQYCSSYADLMKIRVDEINAL